MTTLPSNVPAFNETMRLASLVGTNQSTLRKNKRELYRNAVVTICVEQSQPQKTLLDDIKRKAKYGAMDKADQALFRRELSNVKTVCENWPHFTDAQREAFANGTIADENAKAFGDGDWPASLAVNTLASHCKARDKAADAADAEPESSEGASGDATQTVTEGTDAPVTEDCETFTIEQLVAMIMAGDERTIPLFDAVDAFNAAAVMVEPATGTEG